MNNNFALEKLPTEAFLTAHPVSMSRTLRAEHFDYDDAFYYFLAILGLLLLCFWSRSRVPGSEFHIWERRRAELRELEARTERMSNPEYRMNLILKAIIVKKIIQEKGTQLILGDDDGTDDSHSAASGSHHSIDSMDENANTCVICIDSFRVGDVVAWSSMLMDPAEPEACNHVFHKECLLAWLMHGPTHDACPYCRSPIVKENVDAGSKSSDQGSSSSRTAGLDDSGRSVNSAFVIMHGLVSRVRRAASASVIGQSINTRNRNEDVEMGNRRRASAPPAALEQTALSMEESQSLTEQVPLPALRRRQRSSSSSSLPEEAGQGIPPGSPVQLRKTVSDISSLPSASFHGPPRPRRFGQGPAPMLPYPVYLRMSSFGSLGSGGRDVSESTIREEGEEEEEDLILRPVSPLTLDMSESDVLDETEFHSDHDHDIV